MVKIKEDLYINHSPFFINAFDLHNDSSKYTLNFETILEYDREDLYKIDQMVVKFLTVEKVITSVEGKIVCNPEFANIVNWKHNLCYMNFRSLVCKEVYDSFLNTLMLEDQYALNQFIDLYVRILSSFDIRLANTLCNRVLNAIATIPFDVSALESVFKNPNLISWQEIHKKTPFMWVIIYTQQIIRSAID